MIKKILIIIMFGIILIPILFLSLFIKNVRIYCWETFNAVTHTYNYLPNDKINQLFGLCVNYLIIIANRLNITYNEVNIWIFCVIWPILTLILLIL
jgi:hypothetical protein